ncbi:MAG: DNA polymerase III, subunit gamma and tau [Acidimicrobiaceae bacterium]|nr:DNA polymerase III, subunit gamma and tau [Acidimicrobiaceae bacterium]
MATQSLYRRYRPRRFSELKGQDHVVRALRDAVMTGREGQAYLFSGPRGTGKTTSARILAKVLNCDNVEGGEPCCECDSCLAVERGTSYDVHELDAASNRGIDAMRDLIEKASLGTAGRHKVYILDEVHMLTKEASAALLKTLEEPPPHVVFVLATTDPQKVLDTIRSRTQHLQFHLLPSDALAEHVKWVADDAGLDLPQAALDAALVRGGGSARDTLSALELLATTGGDMGDVVDLDEFVDGLIDRDPGRVLTAMGHAVSLGHDPRTVTEDLVRHLRNGFLALMAPELVVLPPDQLDVLAGRAQQLGAAGLVRSIERLGSILVDMRHAPDPRILIEVALVQLTSDEAGGDVDAVAARVERLEHQLKELREHPPAPAAAPAPRDPATGRAKLGGAVRRPEPATEPAPASAPAAEPTVDSAAATPAAETTPEPVRESAPAPEPAPAPSVSVTEAWQNTVKGQLKPLVRALYSAGEFVGETDGVWSFSVPNEAHGAKCAEHRPAVEAALSAVVGAPVSIRFVAADGDGGNDRPSRNAGSDHGGVRGGGGNGGAPAAASAPAPTAPRESPIERATRAAAAEPDDEPEPAAYVPDDDDDIDLTELTDAPPEAVKTPVERLAEAFPGSELIPDDRV